MLALVPVIWPKLADGALFELPHDALGTSHSTWLGALNISIRNCRDCFSVTRKSLIVEKSKFTCLGPRRSLRAQLPNCGATVL